MEGEIGKMTDAALDARCRPAALAAARALLRQLPWEDAEECANDVMLRLLSRREEYDPARGSLETYVRVMARSAALDRLRRAKPQTLPLEEELYLTGEEEYIGDIVEEVLGLLKPRERQLFTLRFLECRKPPEGLMFKRFGLPFPFGDAAEVKTHISVRVFALEHKPSACFLNRHGELFGIFAGKRLQHRFAGFELTSGKLPPTGVGLALRAACH